MFFENSTFVENVGDLQTILICSIFSACLLLKINISLLTFTVSYTCYIFAATSSVALVTTKSIKSSNIIYLYRKSYIFYFKKILYIVNFIIPGDVFTDVFTDFKRKIFLRLIRIHLSPGTDFPFFCTYIFLTFLI